MPQHVIAAIALGVVLLMIALEVLVQRSRRRPAKRRSGHRHARRQPLLEDRILDALHEPQTQYGQIFESFAIWKVDQETRMEVFAGKPWLALNEFTRLLVVRHVWRTLEKLARGSVIVIDEPPLEYDAQTDREFDDRGIDPWGDNADPPEPAGPQFVKDR